MANKYYIAYGSNLNLAQMRRRCPGAAVAGTTVLDGFRLLFRGSGTGAYLTIEPWEGGKVPAAVWEVSEENEKSLNRYEGFPTFYRKETMKLKVKLDRSGKTRTLEGFVYIMNEGRPLGAPSGAYLRTCAHGYQNFGFDPRILLDACSNSEEVES